MIDGRILRFEERFFAPVATRIGTSVMPQMGLQPSRLATGYRSAAHASTPSAREAARGRKITVDLPFSLAAVEAIVWPRPMSHDPYWNEAYCNLHRYLSPFLQRYLSPSVLLNRTNDETLPCASTAAGVTVCMRPVGQRRGRRGGGRRAVILCITGDAAGGQNSVQNGCNLPGKSTHRRGCFSVVSSYVMQDFKFSRVKTSVFRLFSGYLHDIRYISTRNTRRTV
jgi:hypothetical protein